MLVLQVAFDSLGAKLALVYGKLFAGFETHHAVVGDLEVDAALHPAEAAMRLDEAGGFVGLPPADGLVARGGPELPDVVCFG